jgi:hypothetical protein
VSYHLAVIIFFRHKKSIENNFLFHLC